MKLDPKILKLAKQELNQHLLSDLAYTEELHRFMQGQIGDEEYLHSPIGFKRFLFDYKVGRTLQAGDKAKIKILDIIRSTPHCDSHVETISSLANTLRNKKLSSRSGNRSHGLPQSFASKWLTIYRPDQIIPFDSYALKSIQLRTGLRPKDLTQYFEAVENFRTEFFEKGSKALNSLTLEDKRSIHQKVKSLKLDFDLLLSWKLTDKYLWCEEYLRRMG